MIAETSTEEERVGEEIYPKDIQIILRCSRAKAYYKYNQFLAKLSAQERLLTVDQFCELTGIKRIRVIPHIRHRVMATNA